MEVKISCVGEKNGKIKIVFVNSQSQRALAQNWGQLFKKSSVSTHGRKLCKLAEDERAKVKEIK